MKSLEKILLHGEVKADGKVKRWVVAVFPNVKAVQSYAGILKVAYGAKDEKSVREMDPHAPHPESGTFSDVPKFTMSKVQYDPAPAGLDEELTLS